MKKISFNGKEYLRAADIAKKFRYTQDYVGQLCRAGKVDARRVGRVWYVEPLSVSAYQQTKHLAQKEAAATVKQPTKKPVLLTPVAVRMKPRVRVEPMLRSKTARLAGKNTNKTPSKSTSITPRYTADAADLTPATRAKASIKPPAARKQTIRIKAAADAVAKESVPEAVSSVEKTNQKSVSRNNTEQFVGDLVVPARTKIAAGAKDQGQAKSVKKSGKKTDRVAPAASKKHSYGWLSLIKTFQISWQNALPWLLVVGAFLLASLVISLTLEIEIKNNGEQFRYVFDWQRVFLALVK